MDLLNAMKEKGKCGSEFLFPSFPEGSRVMTPLKANLMVIRNPNSNW